MGVPWEDCPIVAELLGTKLFLNEFVAYQGLSEYKRRRLAGAEEWVGARKQWISVSILSVSCSWVTQLFPKALTAAFPAPNA